MYLLGYSIDNLSLMALTLAVGFVVDDAIVMLENIVRHIEMGKPPLQAALDGAAEVGFTILSMTLSLAAVFIPLVFMAGIIGRLFREFAVTIMIAILVSGFVSLTLTPMLCARFLKSQKEPNARALVQRVRARVRRGAARLRAEPRVGDGASPAVRCVFSALILVATGVLFVIIPKGLFPADDTGFLIGHDRSRAGHVVYGDGAAADARDEGALAGHEHRRLHVERRQLESGQSQHRAQAGGAAAAGGPDGARAHAPACPASRGCRCSSRIRRAFASAGEARRASTSSRCRGTISLALYASAQQLAAKLRTTPPLTDVTTDLQNNNPQVTVRIDRDRASVLGVTPAAIERALANAYSEQQTSTIYTSTNEYWVLMQLVPSAQMDENALTKLYVTSSNGRLVPLSDVAEFERSTGPSSVAHSGQLASVTDLVQSAAGGKPERRGRRGKSRGSLRCCRRPSPRTSRERRRCSRRRSRGSACCC